MHGQQNIKKYAHSYSLTGSVW